MFPATPRSRIRPCSGHHAIRLRFREKIPLVKRKAFQVTADEIGKKNPKAKAAKLEQFYDNGLVQELINEGFFASLWGKWRGPRDRRSLGRSGILAVLLAGRAAAANWPARRWHGANTVALALGVRKIAE